MPYPKGKPYPEEAKQRIREKLRAIPKTEAWNRKNSEAQKGKVMSEVARAKMSTSAKVRIARDGNPMDRPEVLEKLLATMQTEEYRQSLRAAKSTPEHKEVMTRVMREAWVSNRDIYMSYFSSEEYREHFRENNPMYDPDIRAKHKQSVSSPEHKDLLSQIQTIHWQDPKFRQKVIEGLAATWRLTGFNGLNDKVAKFFDEHGVIYEREYLPFKDKPLVYDFAFPDIKVLLEVMGCRWHCCPTHVSCWKDRKDRRKWEIELRIEFDQYKRVEAEARGWILVYLWEHSVPGTEYYVE